MIDKSGIFKGLGWEKKDKKLLHILRNPYGYKKKEIREVALVAADEIERLKKEYKDLMDWAEKSGLDICVRN